MKNTTEIEFFTKEKWQERADLPVFESDYGMIKTVLLPFAHVVVEAKKGRLWSEDLEPIDYSKIQESQVLDDHKEESQETLAVITQENEEEKNIILETSIDDLNVPPAVISKFKDNDIKTINELAEKGVEFLSTIRGLGDAKIKTVIEALHDAGFVEYGADQQ